MSDAGLKRRLRIGYIVFSSLISIKIGEYLIATIIREGAWPYLAVLALVSAWLIIYYYKHIHDLWRSEDKNDE